MSVPDGTALRPRLVSRPLLLAFACAFAFSTGFYLLPSVVPLFTASGGAGVRVAGLATGTLMLSTVAAEFVTPRPIASLCYRANLAAGLILLAPSA